MLGNTLLQVDVAERQNPQARDRGAVQQPCDEIFQLDVLVLSDAEALCSPRELCPEEMI